MSVIISYYDGEKWVNETIKHDESMKTAEEIKKEQIAKAKKELEKRSKNKDKEVKK